MDQLDNLINQGFIFLQTGVGYDLLIEFSGALLFTVCGFIFLWARRALGPKPHIEDFYRTLSEILHLLYSAQSKNQDGEIEDEERKSEISVIMNKISWLTGQFSAASINQFSEKNQKIIKEIESVMVKFHETFRHRQRRGKSLTDAAKDDGKKLGDLIEKLSGLPKGHKTALKKQLDKLK
ncbi:MAG: hypothetical protein ACPH4G_10330 [Henriciella sp.]